LSCFNLFEMRRVRMKAYAIDEIGTPGSLQDLPVPEPEEGQVRISVAAAGVNPFDNAVIQGYLQGGMEHRFPLVPGMDASGTVEAVGDGVEAWSIGDEVFGSVGKRFLGGGTLAELGTMAAGTIARKPFSIDHLVAAAIPVAGVTALTMADTLQLSEGQIAVVVGATGGVGSYFVQLATRRGARVVAVCSGQNGEYARGLGAVDVIDYTTEDAAEAVRSRYPSGIDAVADMHGDGEGLARLAEYVRPGGHVSSAVGAADVDALGSREIEATNVSGRVTTASLETLVGMLDRGEIVSPEIRALSLAEADQALSAIASGHTRGKIVVTPR
jgi:NADPH:quinone reductase